MGQIPLINTDQASAWDGDDGGYWVDQEPRYEVMLQPYTNALLQAAGLRDTDRVLDVGCGCGGSTRAAARQANKGFTLGVDLSRAMLARAREHAVEEGLHNLRFEHADAQVSPFEAKSYDAILSRFGVMFFENPVQAFQNLHRALKPSGVFTAIVWQSLEQNAWIRELRAVLAAGRTLPSPPTGSPGPLGLANTDYTRQIFFSAGFSETTFTSVRAPLFYGETADIAFPFISGMPLVKTLLEPLSPSLREKTLEALRWYVEQHATVRGVFLESSAWIIQSQRDG